MADIDRYLETATRDHTRRSYQSAIRHFEREWGGFLSASADNIAQYLAEYAQTFSINMLRQRSAAITQWHISQGFPDPARAPHVCKVLESIQALYLTRERRAKPLQFAQLEQLVAWLDAQAAANPAAGDVHPLQIHARNRALVLIGFWRGFRSDELGRLQVRHIMVETGRGVTIFLPRTETDRNHVGTTHKAPALSRLCPVAAYEAWLGASGLTGDPVFRRIDCWGRMVDDGLQASSVVSLPHSLFRGAGLAQAGSYSSHSLRRGFAIWASGRDGRDS